MVYRARDLSQVWQPIFIVAWTFESIFLFLLTRMCVPIYYQTGVGVAVFYNDKMRMIMTVVMAGAGRASRMLLQVLLACAASSGVDARPWRRALPPMASTPLFEAYQGYPPCFRC